MKNNIKYAIFIISLFLAVGVTCAMVTLRGMPEAFDWEDDDEESMWGHDLGGEA
jgi:hypothetical protein